MRNARGIMRMPPRWQTDPDAADYIRRVETADGQSLNNGVRIAIFNFIRGCKIDGNWSAIKACCIMMGANTLSGALTPLVGSAPTNFNFVGSDYNPKTGLIGNGSTKYLDTNRNNNADPQDNNHNAVYISAAASITGGLLSSDSGSATGSNNIYDDAGGNGLFCRNRSAALTLVANPAPTGFIAHSRISSASFIARAGGASTVFAQSSGVPFNGNLFVFKRLANYSNARISYYSVGESVDSALFDARVTTLVSSIAAILP